MKAVLQRVKYASVAVGGEVIGECREGLLVLLGVAEGDTEEDAHLLAAKILKLRIFCDENGKMNLSLLDIGGELLIIKLIRRKPVACRLQARKPTGFSRLGEAR